MEATTYRGGVRNRRIRALRRLEKNHSSLQKMIKNETLEKDLEKYQKEYKELKMNKKADPNRITTVANRISILQKEVDDENKLFSEQKKRIAKMEAEMAILKTRI